MAVPTKDAELVPYVGNWNTRIATGYATFGLTSAQATVLSGLSTTYNSAYDAEQASIAAGVKNKSLTTAKNDAKKALLQNLRQLYSFVQASTSVTDSNKNLLDVVVRKTTPSPVPAPGVEPGMQVVSSVGNTVTLRFFDKATPSRRGKPPGCTGLNLFSYVGATPPAGSAGWQFEGGTGKLSTKVTFDPSVAPGSKVWFTGFWINTTKKSGPPCAPLGTNLPGGSVSMAA